MSDQPMTDKTELEVVAWRWRSTKARLGFESGSVWNYQEAEQRIPNTEQQPLVTLSSATTALTLRDEQMEDVRDELADAWPEDREAVLAGPAHLFVVKLRCERDDEIAITAQQNDLIRKQRAEIERLKGLVEEAVKGAERLANAQGARQSSLAMSPARLSQL